MKRAGFVVVSEGRYPGQRVRLDGEAIEPFTANAMAIGLPVGPGHHAIEITYEPAYGKLVPASMLGKSSIPDSVPSRVNFA